MAGLQDVEKKKKKVPSIYTPGSPTANAQKTSNDMAQGIADVADKYAGGAGARAIGRGVKSMASGFLEDIQNTRAAVGKDPLTMPGFSSEAQAGTLPDIVEPKPIDVDNDGKVSTLSEPGTVPAHGDQQLQGGAGPVTLTNVGSGNEGGRAVGGVKAFRDKEVADRTLANYQNNQLRAQGVEPRVQNPDGSLQVGNMDVAFDGKTNTLAQQKAFLRDPIAPTTRTVQTGGRQPRGGGGNQIDLSGLLASIDKDQGPIITDIPGLNNAQNEVFNRSARIRHQREQNENATNRFRSLANLTGTLAGVQGRENIAEANRESATDISTNNNLADLYRDRRDDEFTTNRDKTLAGYDREGDKRDLTKEFLKAKWNKKAPQMTWVKPEFDNNDEQIPGTGIMVNAYGQQVTKAPEDAVKDYLKDPKKKRTEFLGLFGYLPEWIDQ